MILAAPEVTRGVVNGSHWWMCASTTVIALSVTMSVCGSGDSETSDGTRRWGVARFTVGVPCDLEVAGPARNHRRPYAFHAQKRARQGVGLLRWCRSADRAAVAGRLSHRRGAAGRNSAAIRRAEVHVAGVP